MVLRISNFRYIKLIKSIDYIVNYSIMNGKFILKLHKWPEFGVDKSLSSLEYPRYVH